MLLPFFCIFHLPTPSPAENQHAKAKCAQQQLIPSSRDNSATGAITRLFHISPPAARPRINDESQFLKLSRTANRRALEHEHSRLKSRTPRLPRNCTSTHSRIGKTEPIAISANRKMKPRSPLRPQSQAAGIPNHHNRKGSWVPLRAKRKLSIQFQSDSIATCGHNREGGRGLLRVQCDHCSALSSGSNEWRGTLDFAIQQLSKQRCGSG